MLYQWINIAQTALLPPTCLLCGDDGTAGLDLCRGCWRDLPDLGRRCACCAVPLPGAPAGARCGQCQNRIPPLTADALFHYAWPVDRLLHDLKYRRRIAAGRTLGCLMGLRLRRGPGATLVPVPLHPRRERRRGFNQAAELARGAARASGLPLASGVLVRQRPTDDQIGLDAAARRRNMRRAFRLTRPAPARVCLIDDVMTTGATLAEAARELRHGGAEEVLALTVARAGKA